MADALKVLLLYAPPWKIRAEGGPTHGREGPPADYQEGDLDPDFHQIPYGLLTIGASAVRDGHRVKVLNLSSYPWPEVETVVSALDAEVVGLSCWTANRRGVGYVADLVRARHPESVIVVGGPHATPLATEMLAHHASVDLVVEGEGEVAFAEILRRVARGDDLTGIPGTHGRLQGKLASGPPQRNIDNLDDLACPHELYDTHIVMTSRGCPWQCTFCGAETSWGRGFRAHSVSYVLDALEQALSRLPVRMIQIKDDTFTTNKKRVIELCRGMRERKLRFLWSCDTRVDVLSEELLREMRLAGCERLSLGVESGSQRILDAIAKKITVEEIVEATRMAKKFGVKVRFYMMLGNRGETHDSFQETLQFLDRAAPHSYIFSCLSIYPGTTDFVDAERARSVSRDDYFRGNFQELKIPFDAGPELTREMNEWFAEHRGVRELYRPSVSDCEAILRELGDHAPAWLDLAQACFAAGELTRARQHAERALELEHPTPGLVHNLLACIAHARGDLEAMKAAFLQAAKSDPQHAVLIENVQRTRRWFSERGPERGTPLVLDSDHGFRLFERNQQPALPGPLPDDWRNWPEPLARKADETPKGRLPVLQ
ncbi:MAG: radical SAM protein [Polyangiaceae bacterium]